MKFRQSAVSKIVFSFIFFAVNPFISADDFRADNEFQWLTPRSDTVKSIVYFIGATDFISVIGTDGEITFYSVRQDTEVFTLLNPALRIQTLLDVRETKKNIEDKRKSLETRSEPQFVFIAKPQFTREEDKTTGTFALQSPWFDYKIETETADAAVLKRYLDFCDASCYLNFRINPTIPAPLVRLKVNEILRQENRFPKTLEMSFFPKGKSTFFQKEEKARSSHRLVMRLDDADRKKITLALEYVRTFTVVPFDEYQKKSSVKE